MPPTAELPGFLAGVAPILDRWGYLAIAGVIGVESFGVPAPGQTIMVAAAIYAGAGRMNIYGVAAICFVAAVLGDNVGYWIGKRGGRKVVHRFGKYIFLTPARFEKAEKFFERRGNRIVLVARFIDGLRQLNGVIAGVVAMPWRTFLLYNAIGAALWVGWWTTVSYLLGNHLVSIFETVERYKWWAIGLGVLGVGAYVFWHVRLVRRRRARADSSPDSPAPELSPESSPTQSPESSAARSPETSAALPPESSPEDESAVGASAAPKPSPPPSPSSGAAHELDIDGLDAAARGAEAGSADGGDDGRPAGTPTHTPRRATRNASSTVNHVTPGSPAAAAAARAAAADADRTKPKP